MQQQKNSTGPILFLYYEESLVSSNLNSKLFGFHCVRPNVDTDNSTVTASLTVWSSVFSESNS